ncbi:L-seryl-tRNA(Sec) selenium transferase [Kibdelosporangium philippinense]|uniref:L-seryl-tRNA(Sec) selenium transferase n=1 Tax=Kibdelosporangium philippinense TaxID=211113 RepID=A0ABS8Z3Y5_9PSEU|nr:L-seryl-tRNA(Sec) selenium transferase [Kibdelosporangium philippinense]MCE7002555.1 L-seryl-tRNA(Sec) selenium transferase [Kibdelosporangium philippinense]
MTDRRRDIPGTDTVLADPRLAKAIDLLGKPLVKKSVLAAQTKARSGEIEPEHVIDEAITGLPWGATSLQPVINATGVLVHTNLGRAPLSQTARDALVLAAGTTDVEFDLRTGQRAKRGRGALQALHEAVPNAGGVHVVNNNAAALLLTAMVLAPGKEIVISRGELVEIGDGFRIPELLASTGARLREVGTTNRTSPRDYQDAVTEQTGFVLKVHPSNFKIAGFTADVPVSSLAGLGIPLVVDIGSGLLRPHPLLPDEPDATSVLRAGANLVTASGDKLMGGPQAGLLLGDVDLVEKLRRHPAARALRVDKLTLAALEATLHGPPPPVVSALDTEVDLGRAQAIQRRLPGSQIVQSTAVIGGGGAPGVELPSLAISLPEHLSVKLRQHRVVGRVERGRCLLDLRTVPPEDDEKLIAAVLACM